MELEQTTPCRTLFKWIVLTLCTLLFCSCNGDQSPSGQSGALAFKFVYRGTAAGESQTRGEGFQCLDIGVETIEALVLDASGKQIAKGGPWHCERRRGTIDNVAIGTNRTVVLLGRDADKNVIFRGEQSSVQVDARLENKTGVIDCYDFVPSLQMLQNGALVKNGTMPLEWTAVTGASQYRVQLSENKDMTAPLVVDEITKDVHYFLKNELSTTNIYYWRVLAVDAFGHEGQGSEVKFIGANSMFKVATGYGHTVAIKSDGTLWSWGGNFSGELGLGDHGAGTERLYPTQVGRDTHWHQVAAGEDHTVGIKTDGTLWVWGSNDKYQLGVPLNNEPNDSPTQIGSDRDWYQVAAGDYYTIALKANGELWSWGANDHGQLGLGGKGTHQFEPVRVKGSDWAYVSAGANHTLAIKTNGELWGWGDNELGQLGLGGHRDYSEPIKVDPAVDWTFVSAGSDHSVAVKTSGEIWTWGNNTSGQLGSDIYQDDGIQKPSHANPKRDWVYAVASSSYTFAINRSGELWAWGDNSYSQLGVGYSSKMAEPEMVGDGNWVFVVSNHTHAAAVKLNGEIWCWGRNYFGQVGNSEIGMKRYPVSVNADTDWDTLAISGSSYRHTLVTKTNGELWGWGRNIDNQLGIPEGEGGGQDIPVKVNSDGHWKVISAGNKFSVGIKETHGGRDSTLWAWGDNSYGQLGQGNKGSFTERDVPTQVGTDTLWLDVVAGGYHTVAIKSDGTLWSWGNNEYGQLGLGDKGEDTQRTNPTQIITGMDCADVSAGLQHTVAIMKDDTLWSWGKNEYGQLGLGNGGKGTERSSPTQIGADNDWAAVSANTVHTVAIKKDGTLWSWGRNNKGQLGLGDIDNRNRPTLVGSESENNWSYAAAGDHFTIAIKTDGTLWAWGSNYHSKLGDEKLGEYSTNPSQIGTDSDWTISSSGAGHTIAIKQDGTLWSWGFNHDGQLGDGSAWEEEPIHIPLESSDN